MLVKTLNVKAFQLRCVFRGTLYPKFVRTTTIDVCFIRYPRCFQGICLTESMIKLGKIISE